MTTTTLARVHPVHLRRSLALQAFGNFDPTATWPGDGNKRFSKTFSRGSQVCTVTLSPVEGGVEVTAEGEEASSVVEELCLSLETQDGYDGFVPDSPAISRLHRELPGLRLFRVPWLFDIACSVILQQRVKSTDAMRDWKSIAVRFGTKSPNGLVAFPNANTLSAIPLTQVVGPGDLFGYLCFCDHRLEPHGTEARATVQSTVLRTDYDDFRARLKRSQSASIRLTEALCNRVAEVERRARVLAIHDAPKRLATLLYQLAMAKLGAETINRDRVAVHVTHGELAARAALTRPHTTVLMTRLRGLGCISYERGTAITVHFGKLAAIVE